MIVELKFDSTSRVNSEVIVLIAILGSSMRSLMIHKTAGRMCQRQNYWSILSGTHCMGSFIEIVLMWLEIWSDRSIAQSLKPILLRQSNGNCKIQMADSLKICDRVHEHNAVWKRHADQKMSGSQYLLVGCRILLILDYLGHELAAKRCFDVSFHSHQVAFRIKGQEDHGPSMINGVVPNNLIFFHKGPFGVTKYL